MAWPMDDSSEGSERAGTQGMVRVQPLSITEHDIILSMQTNSAGTGKFITLTCDESNSVYEESFLEIT